jgi:hypothetical protein
MLNQLELLVRGVLLIRLILSHHDRKLMVYSRVIADRLTGLIDQVFCDSLLICFGSVKANGYADIIDFWPS